MGKIMKFGKGNVYSKMSGKGKDLLNREAAVAKALREQFTDEQVEQMKKELEAEVEDDQER